MLETVPEMSRGSLNEASVAAKRTCKYLLAHILLEIKQYLSTTSRSTFVVTIGSIIIRCPPSSYYVTSICCAISSPRGAFSPADDKRPQLLCNTYPETPTYLPTSPVPPISYSLIVRHGLNTALITILMRLFRQRPHVRYGCLQNPPTHLPNPSRPLPLLQMVSASRTSPRYSCKASSTTSQAR